MTAATDKWITPEELTAEQKAIPVVAAWKYVETTSDGSMKAVDLISGKRGELTAAAVTLQGLKLGNVSEVREGKTREEDVVVLYTSDYKL